MTVTLPQKGRLLITANENRGEMKSKKIPVILVIVESLCVLAIKSFAAQDRVTLKAPNRVAFSEFRGDRVVQKKNAVSPDFVEVPDTLKSVSFIEKDLSYACNGQRPYFHKLPSQGERIVAVSAFQ
jgi:hypothetical protein